jgi:ferrochelatase
VDKLRAFYNHPLFIAANVGQIHVALEQLAGDSTPHLVFTAHSIPESMAANCDYAAQLNETAKLVAEASGYGRWQLVYQSRSGSPLQPWLGPDICDYLRKLKSQGVASVIVSPIGFVSDHMEVIYDLDIEARRVAGEIGLQMVRAGTAGTHPAFVKMIRELILERTEGLACRALGTRGPSLDVCPIDCCI